MTVDALDPRRTALLMMDYQQGILAPLGDREHVVDRAGEGLRLARRSGMTVAHVMVALTPADGEAAAANRMFGPLFRSGFLADGAPTTAILPALAPAMGERVYRKTRVGAFSTTALDTDLRTRGVDTLLLGGVHTGGVVLSTVRDAADRDFRLVVVADMCADPDPAMHAMLIGTLFPRQAAVIAVDALPAMLG